MALPHVVLGIARDASLEEVVKAYRSKAMKMHPENPVHANGCVDHG